MQDKENILCVALIVLTVLICFKLYYDSDTFQLKCIVSDVDGNKYCIRERKNMKKASDLLARTTVNMTKLVKHLEDKFPDKEHVKFLANNYNSTKIKEILPTSEYTAYSENKGEKIAFCLGKDKKNVDDLIDENTLMFVALHELSHLATKTIGHDETFWNNFKFILKESEKIGIYKPVNYKSTATSYCGTTIKDNPYYDA